MEIYRELLQAASKKIGKPFRHHYKPEDLCQQGSVTIPECMSRGMDNELGYDCSGLVIASFADVLGLQTNQWPSTLRHVPQMVQQATGEQEEAITAFNLLSRSGARRWHIGINNGNGIYIQANAISKKVDSSPVIGDDMRIIPIDLKSLLRLIEN